MDYECLYSMVISLMDYDFLWTSYNACSPGILSSVLSCLNFSFIIHHLHDLDNRQPQKSLVFFKILFNRFPKSLGLIDLLSVTTWALICAVSSHASHVHYLASNYLFSSSFFSFYFLFLF